MKKSGGPNDTLLVTKTPLNLLDRYEGDIDSFVDVNPIGSYEDHFEWENCSGEIQFIRGFRRGYTIPERCIKEMKRYLDGPNRGLSLELLCREYGRPDYRGVYKGWRHTLYSDSFKLVYRLVETTGVFDDVIGEVTDDHLPIGPVE